MERVGVGQRGGTPVGVAHSSPSRVGPLSPWGYLVFTLWAVLVAAFVGGWRLAGLAGLELAFGLAWSRKGLQPLRRPRFWVFILSAVALGLFLDDEPDLALGYRPIGVDAPMGPLRLSQQGLATGLEMAGRAFVMTLAFSLGMGSLSLSDVVALFDRLGLRGLGFATGLAMNLLGTLREMATVTLQTIRLRGGLKRPLVGLRLFLVTLVSNTLRYGDQVVNAATVRAFDPSGGQSMALPLRRADLWLFIVLAGYSVALLTLGR